MSGEEAEAPRYLTEPERAVKASLVGLLLGVALRLLARR
jgi:hypothetical protein